MTDNLEGLVLRLTDYETVHDSPITVLEFTAEASAGSFRGHTPFTVEKRDLDAFIDALDEMADILVGDAHLRCGVGDRADFEMTARFIDSLGHIAIEPDLAVDGPRERPHRVSIDFQTDPVSLQNFTEGWRQASKTGDTAPIELFAAG